MCAMILRPPLRDAQCRAPRWYCSRCWQEQYETDKAIFLRGRWLCRLCVAEMTGEEDEDDALGDV